MIFNEKDLKQFTQKGIDQAVVEQQIQNFKTGFPFADNKKAATIGDGILKIAEEDVEELVKYYDENSKNHKVFKFVPASGAASRMFKALFAFMNSYDKSAAAIAEMEKDQSFKSVFYIFDNLKKFAFYDELRNTLSAKSLSIVELLEDKDYVPILKALLTEDGLNYGSLPKGLLTFHKYKGFTRTPLEEHLVEGARYCKSAEGKVYLHFTVSPEHHDRFITHIHDVKSSYETLFDVKYVITLSEQKPSTDTIAVEMDDAPFRMEDGSILFRPGGHGALIENVNALDGDIVFIKNIDNVVPDAQKDITYTYKKIIGGILLQYQERIFKYINTLENTKSEELSDIITFLQKELCIEFPASFEGLLLTEKINFLLNKLRRPIRVCGMVKNEGEPGGGPFWTTNADGSISLQIIESAQIDKDNAAQMSIMENATHFNPVDVVCSLKDHQNEPFDLLEFRDPQTGFIAYKSKNGRELKAQELPGLWNGAMANWNTIFVEVPILTFNPVKIVNDLLRDTHQ